MFSKKLKNKDDLIKAVLEQIKLDVHCGTAEIIEELICNISIEKLVAYLPEEEGKHFKHLIDPKIDEKIETLIKEYPNDLELGKELRKLWTKKNL